MLALSLHWGNVCCDRFFLALWEVVSCSILVGIASFTYWKPRSPICYPRFPLLHLSDGVTVCYGIVSAIARSPKPEPSQLLSLTEGEGAWPVQIWMTALITLCIFNRWLSCMHTCTTSTEHIKGIAFTLPISYTILHRPMLIILCQRWSVLA